MASLDLRPGATVQYSPAHSDEWREWKLIKSSPNREEWLVEDRFGRFLLHVRRLSPAPHAAAAGHGAAAPPVPAPWAEAPRVRPPPRARQSRGTAWEPMPEPMRPDGVTSRVPPK